MSKRLLMLIAGLVAAALIGFTVFSKMHSSTENEHEDPAFSAYISAFTSGIISSESSIRILLTNEIQSPIEIGKPIDKNLFDFSPNIKGTAVWVDSRTIEFRPEKSLPNDTKYKAEFYLSNILDVPDEFETFNFDFQTMKQSFEVHVDGMTTTDKKTLRTQRLDGTLATADVADPKQIEKTVIVSQNGKNLSVSWIHEPNRTTHHFSVNDIARTETAGKVKLTWDGDAIGSEIHGEKVIDIPALGDFKVVDVKVVQSPEQYAVLQFSDPIMEGQNLDGLVTLTEGSALKYVIEGNEIRVYPQARQAGPRTISVETGVKNILGMPLKERYVMEIMFEELKPEVQLIGKGVILPNSNGLIFPFKAVSLKAVDLKILKVYEKNIPQFLQVNTIEGQRELRRVGKVVLKKTIQLTQTSAMDLGKWNTYSFDLAELIKTEPGAIYKVIISFKQEYSTYSCTGSTASDNHDMESVDGGADDDNEHDWDYYGDYYYDDYEYYDYDYEKRGDPCSQSYYRNKEVSRNVLASDLGLIAKRGTDGSMTFVVNNLITTKPVANATIELYDYQLQVLKTLHTNIEGIADGTFKKKPFLMLVKSGTQRGYLKLDDGSSLSVSAFDVSGEEVQKGLKGFIYGERGVWRPGDTLFLSFILEDKENTLPKNHPVQFELLNPQGQVFRKITKTTGTSGFYSFTTTTEKSSPTGNWTARIKVGGAWFTKNIKIETIMPNRLKINLDFKSDKLSVAKKDAEGIMTVKWLHGAVAKNLNAKVEVTLSETETKFKNYDGYVFDDIARDFTSEAQTIFDDRLNEQGIAMVKPNINVNDAAPGMLRAGFKVRVFEQGGAFSVDQFSLPYSPYTSYVGMKIPEGNKFTGMLVTDTNHIIKVATVDSDGKPVSRKLKVQIYKVEWRWWWDSYDGDLANYLGSNYKEAFQEMEITTVNGKGQFPMRVNRPNWGRFYVRVTDLESGHTSGETVYIDWPSWAGQSPKGNEGATLLSFSSDKKQYNVNEDVKLIIPSAADGRALISIESGSKVIKAFWVETKKGETNYSFKVTPDMTPNVYVNVTLVQPHAQTKNDLPIRLYGVIPISVEDPGTHLNPVVVTPEVWKPESKCSFTVSEKDGKEMTYTVAIVDEGLLDLTRFKTPDPWAAFYAHEALGVKTWDMFDQVMGAFGAELSRILAIGGDGDLNAKGGNKANRFKPMVKFFGPYKLSKGEKKKIEFMMPQYVGSVRTMIIAGNSKCAYGSSDKTTPVRTPLMILGTLPRVVGPGEEVDLPVTVFAMEKQVKNVKVEIQANNMFSAVDGTSKTISFKQVGDDVVNFKLKVNSLLGVGKVKIIASSGSEKAAFDIELDVRNPNPKVTNVIETVIEAGKTWTSPYTPAGMSGTNKGVVELSSIPPINLGERLKYLIEYPHGCVEQTTSSVFPQLYLADIMELNSNFKIVIDKNIKAGIERLKQFQVAGGGMSYWPGQYDASDWGTSYAGHFMVEAEMKGYVLPLGLLENWKRYQKNKANSWSPIPKNSNYYWYNNDLEQAYRLYTLALAKAPELGAMNRLKEYPDLSIAAKWRLAAAYVKAGQPETAKKLITNLATTVPKYRELGWSYGSDDRDEAMILETLTLLDMKAKAGTVLKEVSKNLSSGYWMSTQTTAYSLIAVSKFVGANGASNEMRYNVKIDQQSPQALNTKLPVKQLDMQLKGAAPGSVTVTNSGTGIMFARIILEGVPETGDQTAAENDLKMEVNYTTMQGGAIDVTNLEQGTDFIAEVTITNPGTRGEYLQMALTEIFPSGWEIHNTRMDEAESVIKSDYPTYQDIRDDRVYTYFDVSPAKSKVFRIVLNAAYIGKYYLPTVSCEAMYDNTINSRKPGKWVTVVKAGE